MSGHYDIVHVEVPWAKPSEVTPGRERLCLHIHRDAWAQLIACITSSMARHPDLTWVSVTVDAAIDDRIPTGAECEPPNEGGSEGEKR